MASGHGWQGATSPNFHHESAWGVGFGRACGERERREDLKKKTKVFLLPLLHAWGEEERGIVSFKTTPFRSSLFCFLFFFNMKRRRFGQNASFHLNGASTSTSKSALNYLLYISIVSLSISVSAPLVGRVFHFHPWPLIYAIEPLIDQ